MSGRDRPARIASVEDVDDEGNVIEGTGRYAASVFTPSVASPAKEKPNTGRTRKDKSRRDSTSLLTDSDSTVHPHRDFLKKSTKERDKSAASNSKKAMIPTSAMRPPVKHAKTTGNIPRRELEASYYGVNPTVTPASSRPRAQTSNRPVSYYGNPSRPPLANARFYHNQPQVTTPTSFPPPSWAGSGGSGPFAPPPSPGPVITHQQPDYFSRPLGDRFSTARPQSSMGFRPPPQAIVYDDFEEEPVREKSLARRPSTHRKVSKPDDDRRAMPPPRRPATARPTTLAFRPPPSTPARRSVGFDEDDFVGGDGGLFQDISPHHAYDYGAPIPVRTRSRRPSVGATSITYDGGDFRTEVAGRSGRRNSYYGGKSASSGSGYEDKLRQATMYQEETGGPALPLTAESLRKAGRNGGSSRSTRSSGSHDESDYRQSATTRTTRSSNNDEDVTIRVKGSTTLKVGNAEMQCRDGAEINIISRTAPTFRTVGDKSSYMDQDDRRTRVERPATRVRSNSQAGSFSRSIPKYDYPQPAALGYDRYYQDLPHREIQREIPPYPSYPS
ncbi:hypothetical protein B0H67DRAFT_462007, partial [Lasiosphaeris hirsuta]